MTGHGLKQGDKIIITGWGNIGRDHSPFGLNEVLELVGNADCPAPRFNNGTREHGVNLTSRTWLKTKVVRHKHADLIIAWANGAEIEYNSDRRGCWEVRGTPQWLGSVEYRIKPEKSQAELDKEASIAKMEKSIKEMQTELAKIKGEIK